jgi:hypothetical protein
MGLEDSALFAEVHAAGRGTDVPTLRRVLR